MAHRAEILIQPSLTDITPPPSGRILLLHAPAVDLRLPWARWHQPTGLLQIGAALQKQGCDVRFLEYNQRHYPALQASDYLTFETHFHGHGLM